jgi:hypothetical protein
MTLCRPCPRQLFGLFLWKGHDDLSFFAVLEDQMAPRPVVPIPADSTTTNNIQAAPAVVAHPEAWTKGGQTLWPDRGYSVKDSATR